METIWPAKSKIFSLWPFSENVVDLQFERLTKPTFTQVCKQLEQNLLKKCYVRGGGVAQVICKGN